MPNLLQGLGQGFKKYLLRNIDFWLSFEQVEFGEPPTVHTAAHLFKNISYEYRDQLTAGIIVAGWDRVKGGQVYSVPIGGALVRQKASIGGSGSTFLYGFLDANYREDMTKVNRK